MGGACLRLLFFSVRIVSKQVDLFDSILFGDSRFIQQAVGADAQPADQQVPIHDPVIEAANRSQQIVGGGGVVKVFCANRMLGDLPPVAVGGHWPLIAMIFHREIFNIVADCEHQLIGGQSLIHQVQGQSVRHLPHDQSGFLKRIGALEHLAGDDTFMLRLIRFYIRDGTGFPSPCVINEQFGVDAEELIQQFLVMVICWFSYGAAGNVAHRIEAAALQLCRVSFADSPEISERAVAPQEPPIGHFVQLGYTNSVFIRMNMLRYNVHGHLGQIQVRAHSRRGGDTSSFQNIQDDGSGQFPCCHLVGIQVVGNVHEHLINAVGIDVLRSNVFQIYLIDPRAPIDIVGHPGRGHNVVQLQRRIPPHLRVIPGGTAELMSGRVPPALGVDLSDPLHHLEKPCPTGDAIGFQRGSDGEADRLFCAAFVCHYQIRGHGIQPPLHTFHRSVKAFQITANIGPFFHAPATSFQVLI